MRLPARLVLLATAALCVTFVALLGGGFSRAVEPGSYDTSTSIFWFLASSILAAPLWVPALVQSRYPVALKIFRWLGAVALLLPISMFGGIVVHNVNRSMFGLGASAWALAQGIVLTVLCVTCLSILIWPEVRVHAKRAI